MNVLRALLIGGCVSGLTGTTEARPRPVHPDLSLSIEVMARELQEPRGLAMDPGGKELCG